MDSHGKVLWRRASSLTSPVVSVGSSGEIFLLSEARSSVLLQVLDSQGRLLRSRSFLASQGIVVADPGGGCSVLLSAGLDSAKDSVQLISLDRELRQLSKAPVPVAARGGRTYQLIATPRGHVFMGENASSGAAQMIVGEIDATGHPIWQRNSAAFGEPRLVPFRDGFYVIEEVDSRGMYVEKYVYR